MIQFKVTTDSTDPTRRELLFQLDDKALAGLREAVAAAEKKLATLKRIKRLGVCMTISHTPLAALNGPSPPPLPARPRWLSDAHPQLDCFGFHTRCLPKR